MNTLPTWRSLLYVPVNVQRFIDRAVRTDADAVQLDLEDSIAPSEKDNARGVVKSAAAYISASGKDVIVRINRPLGLAVRDIDASICPEVTALSLPKVESADHVRLISETIAEAESRAGLIVGSIRLIVGIETPRAWLHMEEIASADPRIVAMLLGSEDFASAIGMSPSPENLLGPKQSLVIAAASAGILALGLVGSFANYKDTAAFRAMVERSRAVGFRGSSCIHPSQIAILNEGFSPSKKEVDAARRVVDMFDQARSEGHGALGVDGAMVDLPVMQRARALLALDARVQAQRGSMI
ncbi:HpcH/HpaI aldolase/citrate lyase family protein [Sphingomonas paeninsulae]|nr:CoA ester lyase [Sphingomonas paeninsulae]